MAWTIQTAVLIVVTASGDMLADALVPKMLTAVSISLNKLQTSIFDVTRGLYFKGIGCDFNHDFLGVHVFR